MNNQSKGALGEARAGQALTQMGFTILERNWRCPFGELDIIAREGDTIAFIEVKTRSSRRFGAPAEAVNRTKRLHILRAAQTYLMQNDALDASCRFDIAEVLPEGVRLIRNAFDATDLAD
ncbi:MAG: YraN family protein [Clostridia bacterium]|nr:YraN family protein [Clostridia bacterium]